MKAVILAGGFGVRLSEETVSKPKPLVEIGGYPILWHIMKIYASYGINDFVICLGYKGYLIKEYFYNYTIRNSDISVNLGENSFEILNSHTESWKVTLVDTGLNTMTGGRLKKVAKYLDSDDFCFTYGDGVSDVDVEAVVKKHKAMGKVATLTAVSPGGRFGVLKIEEDYIKSFEEKPEGSQGLINGGFFVLSPKIMDYIKNDSTIFEREPLETLANEDELVAYEHGGFWQCMDTIRDKNYLEELWESNNTPWKIWK